MTNRAKKTTALLLTLIMLFTSLPLDVFAGTTASPWYDFVTGKELTEAVTKENYDAKAVAKRWQEETPIHLRAFCDILKQTQPWDMQKAHDAVMQYVADHGCNMGKIMTSLRLCLVGETKGPDIFTIIDLLGVDETVDTFRGHIIGIAPKFFDEPGILYEHCTELIYTDTMRERKALMEARSGACIVLPGGIGTYEEFFELLTLKQLGQTDRAIVILSTADYYAPMQALLEATAEKRFMSERCMELYRVVKTPEAALEYIKSYTPAATGSGIRDYGK